MKIGLMVFPTLYDTHGADSAASDLGQRLEPSVLSLASRRNGDVNIFIHDNKPKDDIDIYLCSVYTRGWHEFCEFSKLVGRDKIIAGGYHPTARPMDTLSFAKKVVTGLCGNIEEILDMPNGGIIPGKAIHRKRGGNLPRSAGGGAAACGIGAVKARASEEAGHRR